MSTATQPEATPEIPIEATPETVPEAVPESEPTDSPDSPTEPEITALEATLQAMQRLKATLEAQEIRIKNLEDAFQIALTRTDENAIPADVEASA